VTDYLKQAAWLDRTFRGEADKQITIIRLNQAWILNDFPFSSGQYEPYGKRNANCDPKSRQQGMINRYTTRT